MWLWSSQLGNFTPLGIHRLDDKYVVVGIWQVRGDMISEIAMPPVEEEIVSQSRSNPLATQVICPLNWLQHQTAVLHFFVITADSDLSVSKWLILTRCCSASPLTVSDHFLCQNPRQLLSKRQHKSLRCRLSGTGHSLVLVAKTLCQRKWVWTRAWCICWNTGHTFLIKPFSLKTTWL